MDKYLLERISMLIGVSVFATDKSGNIYFASYEDSNPAYYSREFQISLVKDTPVNGFPYVYRDEYEVYFVCLSHDENHYFIGPMAERYLDKIQRHKFYKRFDIDEANEKNMKPMTLSDIIGATLIFTKIITGKEISEEELLKANNLLMFEKSETEKDQEIYSISIEEEDDYRHSYQDEKKLLDMVREGNVDEALKRTKKMDDDVGKLSTSDLSHWKNILVISSTLCARAAIEGGVAPYVAYRISGYYINKGSASTDVMQVINYRNQAVEELSRLVWQQKQKKHTSSYTEQTKDYIRKHFRDKLYLDEIAQQMGITGSYLSRLFKKETGIRFQDYVTDVRLEKASNLLVYSNEAIPKIAEYVNFPSQSYFGRVFKIKYKMTPREYREKYKPTEFLSKNG